MDFEFIRWKRFVTASSTKLRPLRTSSLQSFATERGSEEVIIVSSHQVSRSALWLRRYSAAALLCVFSSPPIPHELAMNCNSHNAPERPESAILDHTRTATTRRNGMLASCEPCRKSKIRCDHRRPICGPCRKRSPKVSCQYQGTLLSKRRFIFHEIPRETTNPPQQGCVSSQNLDAIWNEPCDSALDHTDSTMSNSRRPIAVLQSPRDDLVARAVRIVNDAYTRWRSLSALVRRYHQMSIASLVPPRLLESFLSTVDRSLTAFDHPSSRDTMIRQTAESIVDQTAAEMPRAISTTVADFETYWASSGVRLETLGLICTLAARARVFGLQDKIISRDESSVTEDLLNIGEQSLSLLRTVSPRPNDVWLWLAYEHLKLSMAVRGTKSKPDWTSLVSWLILRRARSCCMESAWRAYV